jgi:cell wall-associated protease
MKKKMHAKIGIFLLSLLTFKAQAQALSSTSRPPKDWWQLDLKQDSLPGISLRQAYDLLKGRPSQTVLVAVLDTPIDLAHEDLRDVIWTNERELTGERIDSDGNGYLNDLHGWCFVCSPDGKIVVGEQDEVTQITSMWRERFEGINPQILDPDDRRDYELYQLAKQETLTQRAYFGQLKEALADSVELRGQLANGGIFSRKILSEKPPWASSKPRNSPKSGPRLGLNTC